MKTENVELQSLGKDLRIGDTIEVWWSPKSDTITTLEPYRGAYENDPDFIGCQIATFAIAKTGMTIFANDDFTLISRR